MSTITIELYDALIEAGVSAQQAKKAAKALNETHQNLATKNDVTFLTKGLYFSLGIIVSVMGAGFGYVISIILNTIITKLN